MDYTYLRGAANLTADVLAGVARELEAVGRSKDLEKGLSLLEIFQKELIRLQTYAAEQAREKTEPLPLTRTNRNQTRAYGEMSFKS